ncbi:MAG TPA: putative quinol monooxygenase [Jatrophihabitans sp.]|nr:putative quinol monooxygenase [Jatrophihabitans sp.]
MAEEFIIAGWMDYGENRDKVLEHFAVCAEHSRAETGCLDYDVAADASSAGRILVFERWQSEPDLAEHFRMPHIAEFRQAIAPYQRLDRSIRRYFIARSEEFQSAKVS